ncbi:MAG: DNA gyrase/topoisomerase IV subunit A [Bacteroidetes bacterium]|nr:DNA gyrase/topoisomerase IV subunit A [Bacteroidota bacterium]
MIEEEELENKPELHQEEDSIGVSGMFESWFLDYASYVILERAVPSIFDGLKPVQRRILHAMDELDDGRFNKVANIIGTTMSYHPHGDMSIGDALVNMGQKDLMMDCQGNWGDIRTGDRSAAPRYIEARLSKFALEVAFNPQTTEWGLSYDGRKKEPIDLPMKFPLLLAQGAEGIAVGLATKILPHNFCELIQASIDILEKKPVTIYPDFLTGGLADCSKYEDGKRGGKVRVRARMEIVDKKTIAIREIPFSTTTVSLIDSILVANDKGKIKIKKVLDNTAAEVEILIELQPGISPSVTMDALFAFTQCEVGISPNCCVIHNDKPVFLGVSEILKINTDHTVALLKRELEIKLAELEDKWHFSSLEKIFIENRIYRDIEECETWEAVIEAIDKGLDPFKHLLMREVTRDDIIRLTEIKIKRISRYDAFKADEALKSLEDEMKAVKSNLKHLIAYSIKYFENLLAKYGKGRERKTELTNFDVVEIKTVAFNNEKLYVNLTEGFIGFGKDMKKEQFLSDCSDIDDIICFMRDGKYKIVPIKEKVFVGKDIIHCAVWKKNDERTTYNAIYRDGKSGKNYAKRFNVTSITRDKEYDVTKGSPFSSILYFSANTNGQAELVGVNLTQGSKAKKKSFEFNFAELEIKGRSSQGNVVTKYPIRGVVFKQEGNSTLGGRKIWLDETVGKLNADNRGKYLGSFQGEDRIIVLYKSGEYMLLNPELTHRFNFSEILYLEKFNAEKIITAIHFQMAKQVSSIKRFKIETHTIDQKFKFIGEETGDSLCFVTLHNNPEVELVFEEGKKKQTQLFNLNEIIEVKGWKAMGNKLVNGKVVSVAILNEEKIIEPIELDEETDDDEDLELDDENSLENEIEESTQIEQPAKNVIIKESKKEKEELPKTEIPKKINNPTDIDFEITNLKDGEQGSLF